MPDRIRRTARWIGARSYIRYSKYFSRFIFIHINKCGGTSVEKALDIPFKIHDTARERIAKIGRARWDAKFTFTVVRNPYAKVASHYRYRSKTRRLAQGADADITLDEWVLRAYGERDPRYFDDPRLFAPCFEWVCDDARRIAVEAVLKLESIDAEWPAVCDRLGVDAPLPHENRTTQPECDPRSLLSREAQAVIREAFADDFEHFYSGLA